MSESPRQIGPTESSRLGEVVVAGALAQAHQSIIMKDAGEPIRISASKHEAFSSFNAGEGP